MLHKLIEEGGNPFFYREADEIAAELAEQERVCAALRRLGEGIGEVAEELDGEGSALLLRLIGDAEELVRDCRRALAEGERLLGELDEERAELLALAGRC